MTPTLVLLVVAAYLAGSIPFAYLAVKWARGIDIRRHGTGNVGAANVLKLTSKRLAIAVTVADIGKGALMVWLAQLAGLGAAAQAAVGVVAVIGHNWPVFLRFQGGRGIRGRPGCQQHPRAIHPVNVYGAWPFETATAVGERHCFRQEDPAFHLELVPYLPKNQSPSTPWP